jgi:ribosomal protein L40E
MDNGTTSDSRSRRSRGATRRLLIIHIFRQSSWQDKESQYLSVRKLQAKNVVVICFLLVLIAAGFVQPSTAQIEKLGYLRVMAQYPVQVPRSYTFQVNVTVEYAFRDYYEISAAIYQGARGTFGSALWEGQVERLIDVGEKTYNVQLTSPAEEGQWLLTGYAFFHNASTPVYFTDQERGPGFVEMNIKVADNAKLTLRASHGNMAVSVDGTSFTTDQNGILVRELKVLTRHSIEAPENVSMTEGWRALFLSWNGTDHENPKTMLVRDDLSLTVDYQDEFRLDAVSEVAQVSGTGWYDAGMVANFSVPLLVPQEGIGGLVGIRWKFTSWSGDIASTDHSESVVMNRPYRVVANYVADYEQLYYFIIGAAVLVVAAVAAFLGLRKTRKPLEQPTEQPTEQPSEEPSEKSAEETAPTVRKFCVFCGANIDPDAKFCSKCGKAQVSSG